MIREIEKWLAVLDKGATAESKGWSSPKNMATWANYLTFDVLGDLCFGEPFNMLESEVNHSIPQVMLDRAAVFLTVSHVQCN